ncbi:hypothetical protein GCM10009565_52990 [Amycolatopsis albidoflavus]
MRAEPPSGRFVEVCFVTVSSTVFFVVLSASASDSTTCTVCATARISKMVGRPNQRLLYGPFATSSERTHPRLAESGSPGSTNTAISCHRALRFASLKKFCRVSRPAAPISVNALGKPSATWS